MWHAKTPDALLSVTMPGGGEWTGGSGDIFGQLKLTDPKRWRGNANPLTGNFKATPLMVNGTMYFNSPTAVTTAVDAATGATKWGHR